ncbi:hypothetical protein RFI_10846 [Reticulomyxa filosa]|uniref:Uncharacterized protein n=1 Tax=Reticulomyxa filosa TaxID=46433 RepID=X6NK57_RETFI|nr:hypothetical protein RFI_10846 [Reticulomyxa filosa]|eukprot:ETO26293.1 hypothetical protein RFI_10846 [Reticulomyxa filosa]
MLFCSLSDRDYLTIKYVPPNLLFFTPTSKKKKSVALKIVSMCTYKARKSNLDEVLQRENETKCIKKKWSDNTVWKKGDTTSKFDKGERNIYMDLCFIQSNRREKGRERERQDVQKKKKKVLSLLSPPSKLENIAGAVVERLAWLILTPAGHSTSYTHFFYILMSHVSQCSLVMLLSNRQYAGCTTKQGYKFETSRSKELPRQYTMFEAVIESSIRLYIFYRSCFFFFFDTLKKKSLIYLFLKHKDLPAAPI